MNTTKHESRGAVACQVDCRVRPPAPMRAVRLTLKLDADDMRELSYALRTIADHADRGELTIGVSGGLCSGYIYELLQDPTMTHDAYHAELRAYLDVLKQPPPVVCGNCNTALPKAAAGCSRMTANTAG